ncbi:glycoside hydrolase family 5 protein [Moniliophthora roreri MCA 2997]|uniref:Glycoside hydrolase family 5 protein n=1 Tax=Moniliophthora roreri (strain MCA 2997) TaxID=1381753 RepID=V2WWK0_MONRO|nr:glycoside hydrolase family 5 protein [Moniliophthora roreri MCA 2997]
MSSSSLDSSYILVGDEMPQTSSSEAVAKNTIKVDKEHPSTSSSYIPGSSKGYAHEWTGNDIRISGRHFVDRYGRVCNLRGVNLSGSCKSPANHDDEVFPSEAESVTFVGRPFPLEEAHEHFSRLRRWGFTFIRFLVTWEAVEHAGPGIYDIEYLAYLRSILELLPRYGMIAFVALHQDVWSRYSGGSGAPAWTLEYVGFDLHELEPTGAAWLKGVKGGGHIESERGLWPCGYQKLAASTMATVFWAGDTFAPKLTIKNRHGQQVTAQEFLQNAFIEMSEVLVKAVGDLEAVIGFEMMNEPHRGYIDLQSLHGFDYNTDLHLGSIPTAFESFQLGAGHPTTVAVWTRSFPMPTRKTGQATLNTEGRKVWRPDGPTQGKCIWEMHGVWGWCKNKDEAVMLRENYFVKHPMTGAKIDWYTDFYYPFLKKWTERVRRVSPPEKIVFVEVIPNEFCPTTFTPEHQPSNMVYAPHWYDLRALFDKAFGDFTVNVQGLSRGMFPLKTFYWGQRGARDNYALQIRNIVESGYKALGEKPVIIGECGVPMDMNKGEAFDTDDFTWQARMMDALITALDRALVGFTLWNYNPYNTDSAGDFWNGENFSWFSRGRALPPFLLDYHQTSVTLDNGGRILPVTVRPYPAKTAGVPIKFEYEVTEGRFVFEWVNPSEVSKGSPSVMDPPLAQGIPLKARETEIFVPHSLTQGRELVVSGLDSKGYAYRYDEERQTLFIVARDTTPGKIHRVEAVVTPKLRRPVFWLNDFWGDWGNTVIAVVVGLLGIVGGIIMLLVMRS